MSKSTTSIGFTMTLKLLIELIGALSWLSVNTIVISNYNSSSRSFGGSKSNTTLSTEDELVNLTHEYSEKPETDDTYASLF